MDFFGLDGLALTLVFVSSLVSATPLPVEPFCSVRGGSVDMINLEK